MSKSKVISGTISELQPKVLVNGKKLTQPYLSALAAIGEGSFCRAIGKKDNGRGRAAKVWEFDTEAVLSISTE